MRNTLAIIALGLVACDGSKDTGGEDETAVAEGGWSASEVSEVDTCGFFDEGEDTGTGETVATLTLTSDTTFTLSDGSPEFDLTCDLADDLTFTCPGEDTVQSLKEEGIDASITSSLGYSGTFTSRTEGSLIIQIDVDCEGGGCLKIKKYEGLTFPCGYTAELAISFVE